MRLGILASHPIQYQAPWFRALAKKADLEVFFAHRQSAVEQGAAGFGVAFDWDVDLLSGYKHWFLENKSSRPDVNRFDGCDTPEIAEVIRGQESGGRGQGAALPRFDAFIVCGWYLKSHLQAVRACRAAGIPVLVRGDSQLRTPRPLLKRLAMEVRQRWLLRQFDGFLSVGKRHREYLEHYGVPREKIFFAPHFVDNEWFARRAEKARGQRSEIRGRWGADETTLVALFVGKFQRIKRPDDLLRGLAHGQARELNAMAVFVGAGELEGKLRELAGSLGVKAQFEGFKNQTDLPCYYTGADVLVLPSGSETWGLVVNEAMACGRPAIVSDVVGCAPDLIENGRTGFTFPAGDYVALANQLAAFAKLKNAGNDFAAAAAEKIGAYTVAAAVSGTIRAMEALVMKRSAGVA